ncbi:MAG: NAD(P)H-dependent oxidoreductase subunit E, partial [Clostridiales bacterium]|nr:NAD(P)H-dependent oxidoreductase subunit E [Clostridiales bacterium]
MCCCEGKDYAAPDKAAADAILSKYRGVLGSLISILQEIQEAYGYIPKTLIPYISEKTEYEAAKIFGVATFYSQFRLEPVGRHLIMLCQGTACHVNGSAIIEEAIQNELGIADGETTPDGLFTLENVACLGCCSR